MATKTMRNPQTQVVVTVPEAEAEKLFKAGWVYSSKYEQKRKAAIARLNEPKSEAA